MQPGPDLEVERTERVADATRQPDGSGRPVERGEEAVAGGVELATLETGELAAYDGVVPLEELPPGRVAERAASSVEPTMSVKRMVARTRSARPGRESCATKRAVTSIVAW